MQLNYTKFLSYDNSVNRIVCLYIYNQVFLKNNKFFKSPENLG